MNYNFYFKDLRNKKKIVFCEGVKIVLFIFPAVGRLFKIAGFTLNIDAG